VIEVDSRARSGPLREGEAKGEWRYATRHDATRRWKASGDPGGGEVRKEAGRSVAAWRFVGGMECAR
jgi:hypothetical protein